MAEFNVRSDSVNVEQIMDQIRSRIRDKRGVDYTEQQLRELAAVKLEKFLDPKGVRSDLLEQFRKAPQPSYEPAEVPNYAFDADTLYETHRGPLRFIRKLLQPILKLFFNPNPLIQALHIQSRLNTLYGERESRRRAVDQLNYELLHNLVLEMTRSGIEAKNLKMRIESLASRLEFTERRMRALESVVVYKTSPDEIVEHAAAAPPRPAAPTPSMSPADAGGAPPPPGEGPGQRSRRRRRRRGRRGGAPAAIVMGQAAAQPGAPEASGQAGDDPAAFVARDDLEQMSGAFAHPSEVTGTPVSSEGRPGSGTPPEPPARDADSNKGSDEPGPQQ